MMSKKTLLNHLALVILWIGLSASVFAEITAINESVEGGVKNVSNNHKRDFFKAA